VVYLIHSSYFILKLFREAARNSAKHLSPERKKTPATRTQKQIAWNLWYLQFQI